MKHDIPMLLSTLRQLTKHYDSSCHDILHPHNSSCVSFNLETIQWMSLCSLKVYLFIFLIMRKGNFSLYTYARDVLKSTVFLTLNGSGIILCVCLLSRIFGKVYKCNVGFFTALIASTVAFPIESRFRQRLVLVYTFSNCIQTIGSLLVSRNYLPSIPYMDVLLFMLVSGRTCARLSSRVSSTGFNDSVFLLLTNPMKMLKRNSYSSHQIMSFWLKKVLPESDALKIPILLTGGCVWGLLIGLSYNIVSLLVSKVSKLLSGSREEDTEERRGRRFNYRIPALLAAYIGLFHLCKIILRNVTPLSDTISGLIAGSAISVYRFPFLSLYLFIKELQSISKSLMYSGYLPRIPYFNYILYFTFCAMQFHCVVFERENVLPSYIRFIHTVSGEMVPNMTRYVEGRECLYAI